MIHFADDAAFLQKHSAAIILSDKRGLAKAAVVPEWQGRVMTSTAAGDSGDSFGWINRARIASGKPQPHMNVFGGEDRFWLGPEGGQFSLFFAKGAAFEIANWFVPAPVDSMPYRVVSQSSDAAAFAAEFPITNCSGARFDVSVDRVVRVLEPSLAWQCLALQPLPDINLVAFQSENKITNAGHRPWDKATGLLSIWILGQFIPSPTATVIIPLKPGRDAVSEYFGGIPPQRLAVNNNTAFFRADGMFRCKIGVSPAHSKKLIASYDPAARALTIVQFSQPDAAADYVNSLLKIQDDPFSGDAINSYNDGPASPGATPLGPFYELETSSPAAAAPPGGSMSHLHRTIHMTGSEASLDAVARAVLGVSLHAVNAALPAPRS
jgi:hypothetical protein